MKKNGNTEREGSRRLEGLKEGKNMWETLIRSLVTYLIPLLAGYAFSMFGLGRRVRNLECDLVSGAEERKRILKSLLACLYGLQEQGCDGPVTEGIRDLETWLYESAHTLKSGN